MNLTRKTYQYLKTLPEFFERVLDRSKPFEMRFNDREFKVGEILVLMEWDQHYTGRDIKAEVTFVMGHKDFKAVPKGWVILGLNLDYLE